MPSPTNSDNKSDVAIVEPMLDEVETFDAAMEAIAAAGLAVHKVNSFDLIEDNNELVGREFLILSWRFNADGNFGPFVSVMAIDRNNNKFVFNDGGTGVRLQLAELEDKGIFGRVHCVKGLRRSDFRFDEKTGNVMKRSDPNYGAGKPATTYYLS